MRKAEVNRIRWNGKTFYQSALAPPRPTYVGNTIQLDMQQVCEIGMPPKSSDVSHHHEALIARDMDDPKTPIFKPRDQKVASFPRKQRACLGTSTVATALQARSHATVPCFAASAAAFAAATIARQSSSILKRLVRSRHIHKRRGTPKACPTCIQACKVRLS